jgi:hypothetical protein
MRTPVALVALASVLSVAPLAGCRDHSKDNARLALADVELLAAQIERDVAEVQRGLPEGAKKMASVYLRGADPHEDPSSTRRALIKAQREVPDLNISKSTFFALADDKGIGLRNNLEQDAMAGQDLLKLFPALSKALAGEYVETVGSFGGPPRPSGPDRDWIAAAPVRTEAGKVGGLFVTGWSLRAFCRHLNEVWKHERSEQLKASGDTGKLPIFYVAIFDKTGVYSAPFTPEVSEKALTEADLVGKTAGGTYSAPINITDRDFGYAAKRTPQLGPDVGVVVLRSEL